MMDVTKVQQVVYAIQRQDGLFSSGGTWPSFGKQPKIWRTVGHIKNHLNGVMGHSYWCRQEMIKKAAVYANCEIVEFVLQSRIDQSDLRLKEIIADQILLHS